MTILAKPTLYRETRFRSRLETRWAVFFDALQMPWTYEPVVLSSSGYQPDFEIGNDPSAYLEVKPMSWFEHSKEQQDADIRGRWVPFVEASQSHLVVLFGEPGSWVNGRLDPTTRAFAMTTRSILKDPPTQVASWVECLKCGTINIIRQGSRICNTCPTVGAALISAMNAARDASYVDAP